MFTKATIATLFASLAAAQLHAPVGEPSGNPIARPSLNEIVPACKAFTITWQPTTPNTVSILLVKGPASNVVKFGPPLAEGLSNSGSLTWTPAADLPGTVDGFGYGLQIIDDVTGQYQWSTQFGISKENCADVSSVVASSSASAGYPAATPTPAASSVYSTGGYPVASSSQGAYPVSVHHTSVAPPAVYSTGAPHHNSTVIQPTRPITVPSSLRPSATGNVTTSRLPEATGAASALQAGLSLAGAVAAVAFML